MKTIKAFLWLRKLYYFDKLQYKITPNIALTIYFSNLQHTYLLLATPGANISRWFAQGFRSQVSLNCSVSLL